jgi:hypothetical protein
MTLYSQRLNTCLYVGMCLSSQGETALMWAAGWSNAEAAVDYLLSIGANVNRQSTQVAVLSRTISSL